MRREGIVEDEKIDTKIDSILRMIHQKIISVYTGYSRLVAENPVEQIKDMKNLLNFQSSLKEIEETISREMQRYRIEHSIIKSKISPEKADICLNAAMILQEMDDKLKKYSITLEEFITIFSAEKISHTEKKKLLEVKYGILSEAYTHFQKLNGALLVTFKSMEKLDLNRS